MKLGVSYWVLFNILNKSDKFFSIINNPDMSNVLAMANVTDDSYECTLIQDYKLKILPLFVIIFETH